ncbi:MAG: sigma-70 family RNA polymerase sigma factor [Steroidobacter sp.]|nr:sigma-70 family RNA polymerase sigma factor [Steroidobacter sp.]
MRYLARVWPKREELTDLRQETYVRVFEAATKARPSSAKAFLFKTAHHLMVDKLRRERVVSIEAVGDSEVLHASVDELSTERRVIARDEIKRLARGFDLLPPKCREVVWLRRVQELPQKEVAQRLGVDEKTVERHVSKGSRLLTNYMLGGDPGATRVGADSAAQNDIEQGERHEK